MLGDFYAKHHAAVFMLEIVAMEHVRLRTGKWHRKPDRDANAFVVVDERERGVASGVGQGGVERTIDVVAVTLDDGLGVGDVTEGQPSRGRGSRLRVEPGVEEGAVHAPPSSWPGSGSGDSSRSWFLSAGPPTA